MKNHDGAIRTWSPEIVTAMATSALAAIAFLALVGAVVYFHFTASKEYTDSKADSVAVQLANSTAEITALRTDMNARFDAMTDQFNRGFDELNDQFDRRLDELKQWHIDTR